MTLHCYIQGDFGDFYDLFTILPDFIEQNKVDKVKFWVDSVCFFDSELVERKQTTISLIDKFGGDYTVVPKECGSYNKADYKNFNYEDIKNIFMPFRKPLTQSYMRSRIKYGDLFIHAVLGIDFTYQWLDSVNIPLTDYVRELDVSTEETFRIFQLLQQCQREKFFDV
jgi:hypothetical protein